MTTNTIRSKDVFTFSLGGIKSVNTCALVPAIDDRAVTREWERHQRKPECERRRAVDLIEDFLARYFASGCHGAH